MQNISNLIISSDFDTLKNEGIITTSVVKPSGAIVPANSRVVWQEEIAVEDTPIDNTYFTHNGDDGTYKLLALQQSVINMSGSSPGPYTLLISAYYTSPTTLLYSIDSVNPYNTSLNTGGQLTVTFLSALYSDPFA